MDFLNNFCEVGTVSYMLRNYYFACTRIQIILVPCCIVSGVARGGGGQVDKQLILFCSIHRHVHSTA